MQIRVYLKAGVAQNEKFRDVAPGSIYWGEKNFPLSRDKFGRLFFTMESGESIPEDFFESVEFFSLSASWLKVAHRCTGEYQDVPDEVVHEEGRARGFLDLRPSGSGPEYYLRLSTLNGGDENDLENLYWRIREGNIAPVTSWEERQKK
ncbi:MAG: hypothetical protein PHS53_00600 [Candidatus Pacebacteria bacterium]|nr:hypothetical protein [Candidatus Paceibacterota bacterium]MDD5356636.1 hypothetical protein [Candidatus Paceibacterota bacterium]